MKELYEKVLDHATRNGQLISKEGRSFADVIPGYKPIPKKAEVKKAEPREKKKAVAEKMRRHFNISPEDSYFLREYSRTDPSSGRKLYRMPEGRYKNVKGHFIKQKANPPSIIHG